MSECLRTIGIRRLDDHGSREEVGRLFEALQRELREPLLDKLKVANTTRPADQLVAFLNREPVGWLGLAASADRIDLRGPFVLRQAQGKGVGTFLVEEALHYARLKGVSHASVAPVADARGFFSRLGFARHADSFLRRLTRLNLPRQER